MDTASYCQSAVALRTATTIPRAVIAGPDGIFTGVLCPVASTLTFVPPTSMTRIFIRLAVCTVARLLPQSPTAPRPHAPPTQPPWCLEFEVSLDVGVWTLGASSPYAPAAAGLLPPFNVVGVG